MPSDADRFAAALAEDDYCPKCGGELDTGFECNRCGYDATPDLYAEYVRQADELS